MHPTWLNDTIRTGLLKLLPLRLDGCPPDDVIAYTAGAWLDAITVDRDWLQDRDQPRIEKAFRILSRDCRKWPAPAHLLEAMPAPDQQRIQHKPEPLSREEAKARFDAITAELNADRENTEIQA